VFYTCPTKTDKWNPGFTQHIKNMEDIQGAASITDANAAPPAVQEQTPVSENDQTQSQEVPAPYHKDPAWQRILGERNTFKTKAQELESKVAEYESQLRELKNVREPEPKELTEKEQLYAEFKDRIFKDAMELEQKQKAEQEASEAKQAEEEQARQEAAAKEISEVREALGSDEAFKEFETYVESLIETVPSLPESVKAGHLSLKDLQALFQKSKGTESVPKPQGIAAPGSSGTAAVKTEPVNRNKSMIEIAREAARDKGIIK
jgi:chromosome segregation ATPase